MVVELPPYFDVNDNGFDDFYEASLRVSGSSTGTFDTPVSAGTVTAAWSRPAGSKNGTCLLKMVDNTYGALGDFNHTFELLEFTGPVYYTPAPTNMTARTAFEQTGDTTNKFGGPWLLTKESTNRFNMIHVAAGTWTNTANGPLSFPSTTFYRDVEWPTNYYGYFDLEDGYPTTPAPDYNYWTISIDDLNDSNSNGIPDFTDDPIVVARPQLTLQLGVNEVLLSISGTSGRTNEIQQSSTLAPGSWQVVRTLLVTNDPQVVSFPLTEQNTYWRALLK
jgi:hypothetical protein